MYLSKLLNVFVNISKLFLSIKKIICFGVQYWLERLYSEESQLGGEHQRLFYVQKCLLSCRKPQFFIVIVVVAENDFDISPLTVSPLLTSSALVRLLLANTPVAENLTHQWMIDLSIPRHDIT